MSEGKHRLMLALKIEAFLRAPDQEASWSPGSVRIGPADDNHTHVCTWCFKTINQSCTFSFWPGAVKAAVCDFWDGNLSLFAISNLQRSSVSCCTLQQGSTHMLWHLQKSPMWALKFFPGQFHLFSRLSCTFTKQISLPWSWPQSQSICRVTASYI